MTIWNDTAGVALDRVTYQQLLARLVRIEDLPHAKPLTEQEQAAGLAALDDLDRLSQQIGAAWQDGMSAADAVKEQRHEL